MPKQHTAANSPDALLRMAEAGFGIVAVPHFITREQVHRGVLMRVLPQWGPPATACWAVFPGRRLMPARTRAFLNALLATTSEYSQP